MPIHLFKPYVNCRYGLHARPCTILVQLQRHFFQDYPIIVVNLETGGEALLNSIMQMMLLAAERGSQLEFLYHGDSEGFADLKAILLGLRYSDEGGETAKTGTYDGVMSDVAVCIPDRKRLIERLLKHAAVTEAEPMFSTTPPVSRPKVPSGRSALVFELDPNVLHKLDQVDPRVASEAVKAAEHLSKCDVQGLSLVRKIAERLLPHVSAAHGKHSSAKSLHLSVTALSEEGILIELDKRLLDFFRLLGNQSVHASAIEDKALLPDRESAYHVFLFFEQLLRRLLIAAGRMAGADETQAPRRVS